MKIRLRAQDFVIEGVRFLWFRLWFNLWTQTVAKGSPTVIQGDQQNGSRWAFSQKRIQSIGVGAFVWTLSRSKTTKNSFVKFGVDDVGEIDWSSALFWCSSEVYEGKPKKLVV